MKHLVDWLESKKFYDLMQQYRHLSVTPTSDVVRAFEAVKEGIREAVGHRTFIISSVGYNSVGRAVSYSFQPVIDIADAHNTFTVPVQALGKKLLMPGTKVVISIEDKED